MIFYAKLIQNFIPINGRFSGFVFNCLSDKFLATMNALYQALYVIFKLTNELSDNNTYTNLIFFLCFSLNIITHGKLLVGLINSLVFSLSIFFFKNLSAKSSIISYIFIILLGAQNFILYFPYIYLTFMLILQKGKSKNLLLFLGLSLFYISLISGGVIGLPFHVNTNQLIFNIPETNYAIAQHQKDALYIPFSIRPLIYSNLIYIYVFFTNIANFINFKNLYDVLLLANLYPLTSGFIYNT